ncbi:cupin domain-containing protein [Mesorhizobium sp. f-mel]
MENPVGADIHPLDQKLDDARLLAWEKFAPEGAEFNEGRSRLALGDYRVALASSLPCSDNDLGLADQTAGDPTKAGDVVVLRAKFPADYQVPPHTHPYAETITVISGSVGFSVGEKVEKKGDLLKPGAFYAQPANHAHYVWTAGEEGIIEVHFFGPGGINYGWIGFGRCQERASGVRRTPHP